MTPKITLTSRFQHQQRKQTAESGHPNPNQGTVSTHEPAQAGNQVQEDNAPTAVTSQVGQLENRPTENTVVANYENRTTGEMRVMRKGIT